MGANINRKVIPADVQSSGAAPADEAEWRRRLRSPRFRRAVKDLVRAEVAEAAALPIREVVDAAKIRAVLGAIDLAVPRPGPIAAVVVRLHERLEKRVRREGRSVDSMMSGEVRAELEALLDAGLPNPEAIEDIVAQMIRQKFVSRLFAELVYSAILAFNKRVNPLFGGLTTAMLDAQIRGFIELGMPMLQEQAIGFALTPANQKFAVDLVRGLIRGALAEPIGDLVPRASAGQMRHVERLLVQVLESERFRAAVPALAQQWWDEAYAVIRDKKLGQLVDERRLAAALVAPVAEAAVAVLSRPRVAALVAEAVLGSAQREP